MIEKTYWKVIIECATAAEDALSAFLFKHNCQGFYHESGKIIACFGSYKDVCSFSKVLEAKKRDLLQYELTDVLSFEVKEEAVVQWDEEWKKNLTPVEVGDALVVLAPWHKYQGARIKIVIEPGMAFGTGHHATTRLCLEEIERLARSGCRSLLDLGTGSGILAVAARKLGIEDVVAIDIDPVAVDVARENAVRNGTADICFSFKTVDCIRRGFDAVVANLTLKTIRVLFDEIVRLCNAEGVIVLSGILSEQEEEITGLLSDAAVGEWEIKSSSGWLCVVLKTN